MSDAGVPDAERLAGPATTKTDPTESETARLDRAAAAALDAFHQPKHPLYTFDSTTEGYRDAWRGVVRAVAAVLGVPLAGPTESDEQDRG